MKNPWGAADQSRKLSDIPGSKSRRPEEEKEWTESRTAIDLHSVRFNSLTSCWPWLFLSLSGNTEALYALVLLLRVPLEIQRTRPRYHEILDFIKKRFISTSTKLPCLGLSRESVQQHDWWLQQVIDVVYDLHAVQHIRKPISAHHGSTCSALYSPLTHNAGKVSAGEGTFLEAPQACLRRSKPQ